MKKGLATFLFALQILLSCVSGACGAAENTEEKNMYYPADEWRTSSPEEQGMDSELLLKMFETIQAEKVPIHSVLIIRNGYLVCEAYFQPFHRDTRHDLFSATKSFTSSLIGIAINEGKIKGVDQKITDIFPDLAIPENSLGLEDSTVENILTMTAGHTADSVDAVYSSSNWPQTFYNQPFSTKPGMRFLYDSGASHLLAAILKKTTGQDVEEYARERLLDPLNIRGYFWEKSSEGINTGGWGLRITPTDMSKFGYMILHKGVWNGKQIVPSGWVETATQKHIEGYWGETRGDDYGYQFWMNPFGGFRADGFAGQFVYILPEYDMVAVFTSGINYSETYQPVKLMSDFVVPAAYSREPLPANADANEALTSYVKELESPTPQAVSPLPDMAGQINGKAYRVNTFISSFSFTFNGTDACTLNIVQQGKKFALPVGLDGVYRVSDVKQLGTLVWYPPYRGVALKGCWVNGTTFIIDWQYVEEPYHEVYSFTFEGEKATMEVTEYVVGCAGPMQPYAKYDAVLKK
jgi:CubicO group peptidase (beta-lactamase class C family)